MIDPSESLARGLERLVAGEATVTLVSKVPEAAKLLQSNEYAAIVADLRAGKEDLVKLFRLVKAKRPETLSILVADEPDSEVVIELINQARDLPVPRQADQGERPANARGRGAAPLRRVQGTARRFKPPQNVGALPGRLVSHST